MQRGRYVSLAVMTVVLALAGWAGRPAHAAGIPGWMDQDFNTSTAGSATVDGNGVWTIKGAGADTWERNDGFHIVYKPLKGDGSVTTKLLGILLLGAAVSVALGVYADSHTPTHEKPYTLFFSGTIQLKVWFATAAIALAVLQLLLAARLYGRIPIPRQAPTNRAPPAPYPPPVGSCSKPTARAATAPRAKAGSGRSSPLSSPTTSRTRPTRSPS